ncbi:hypothetical protein AB0C38_13495 [Amycolatopsis sp. NPDC048633]|uniref:hypothetical protein n=1 Tax=Amycolatopsis sp. NPDC048633 TaxID=3157095 RepID=UPI0033C5E0BD
MDVDFEVHHFRDQPGYLADILEPKPDRPEFLETLSSSANGIGLVIGTNTRGVPDKPTHRDKGGMQDPAAQVETGEYRYVFRGSARPNLTFLYETNRRFEAIVVVDAGTGPLTMRHATRLRDALHELSAMAIEVAEAPLLSVQSPVQLPVPPRAEFEEDLIPTASAKAVRFAIALPRPSAELAFALADRISSYCSEHDLGLWVRDTRLGCRTGNWFEIIGTPVRGDLPQDEEETIEHILPVTFVGPARVGSTRSIVEALADLPHAGVAGCSITLLDDLAFIHLQLALSYHLDTELVRTSAAGKDPASFMQEVMARTGNHGKKFAVRETAGDYQTFAGPLLDYVVPRPHRRLAVWLSWQMNRAGLTAPLGTLAEALADLKVGWSRNPLDAQAANVEYLVCRDLGNSLLRGKGKLSIPYQFVSSRYPKKSGEPSASQFCVALEDAWKARVKSADTNAHIREITISWREYWLGHWAAPIA